LTPELAEIEAALDATWPASATSRAGGFLLRQGAGGGQRVSAATAEEAPTAAGIAAAEAAMQAAGQVPLFRVRPGEERLDALLDAAGYGSHDETNILDGPLEPLAAQEIPRAVAYALWPPLALMEELWTAGGIGPARQAVMARVQVPKAGIIARAEQQPGGVAFAAIHGARVMVHALWVPEIVRRQKTAHRMMICTARWAQDMGARRMGVLCLRHNLAANSLYASLGLEIVGNYHYRAKK